MNLTATCGSGDYGPRCSYSPLHVVYARVCLCTLFLKPIHFYSANDAAHTYPFYAPFLTEFTYLVFQLIYLYSLGINISLTNEGNFT